MEDAQFVTVQIMCQIVLQSEFTQKINCVSIFDQ